MKKSHLGKKGWVEKAKVEKDLELGVFLGGKRLFVDMFTTDVAEMLFVGRKSSKKTDLRNRGWLRHKNSWQDLPLISRTELATPLEFHEKIETSK